MIFNFFLIGVLILLSTHMLIWLLEISGRYNEYGLACIPVILISGPAIGLMIGFYLIESFDRREESEKVENLSLPHLEIVVTYT
jgi:hypothetical protein